MVLLTNTNIRFFTSIDYTCNTWYKNVEDVVLIRKADLENHNRSGGHWEVFNKKVYDIQETR